jgi:hypothetical protein
MGVPIRAPGQRLQYSTHTEYNTVFDYLGEFPGPFLDIDDPYDTAGPYDASDDYDGFGGGPLNWLFTPPTALLNPPYLPETPLGPALSLFRHYTPRAMGVNVFILSNGTVVQDYPTSENQNTNIPYPWDPYYLPPTPFARMYDFHSVETDAHIMPYIVQVYYGGSTHAVTDYEYVVLNDHGYADRLVPA